MSKPTKLELLNAQSKAFQKLINPKLEALQNPEIAIEVLNDMADRELQEAEKIIADQSEKVKFANQIIETNEAKKSISKAKIKRNTHPNFNTNFHYFNKALNVINTETQPLFVSTLAQWQNLFSDNIKPFEKPIELKYGITLMDLRLFIDKLRAKNLIRNGENLKIIENAKAFSFNGRFVTSKSLQDAKQCENYPNTLNHTKVNKIISSLMELQNPKT